MRGGCPIRVQVLVVPLSEEAVPRATYHYDHTAVTSGKAGFFMKWLLY